MSYGGNPTVFEFSNGLNLITGANGQGKSCLLDALSFVLYGQPYRKIKKDELINRKNKKKLHTEIEFKIGDNSYKIVRTLAPSHMEITKNGEELQSMSSKKLNQEEIDKIIGVDYNLFRQIISLAINYNKPFLTVSLPEKRDIIENIFNIKIFGEMLKILKRNSSGLKTKNELNDKTIKILENALRTMRTQLNEMEIAKTNFETDKQKEILEIKYSQKRSIIRNNKYNKNI